MGSELDPIKVGQEETAQDAWDSGAGKRRQEKIKSGFGAVGRAISTAAEGIGSGTEKAILGVARGIGNIPEFLQEQDEANRISNARFDSNERIAEYKDQLKNAAARFVQVPTAENKRIYNDILKNYNAEIKTLESLGVTYTGERYAALTAKDGVPDGVLKDTQKGKPKPSEPVKLTQGTLNKLKILDEKVAKQDFAVSEEGLQVAADTAAIISTLRGLGIEPTIQNIAAYSAGDGSGGPSTQRSYQQFNSQQTAGLANQIAKNLLGRELTKDEVMRATENLNFQAQANPTVTTTSGGTTVQSGGIDAEQILREDFKLAPEYESYQKATTYFDAMIDALRGPAGGSV